MKIPSEYLNQIITGDARVLAERIPDESVDLIFTDPPYPREYLSLYGWLAETAARVLKPGGSLMTLSGHQYLLDALDLIRPHLNYHWMSCLYQEGENNVYRHFPRRIFSYWKPILWFTRGTYAGPMIPDVVINPIADKRHHLWGQGQSWAVRVLRRFSDSTIIFDPFTGGGTVPAVCKMLGRNYIAFEIDPATAERARERVAHTQAMHPVFLEEQHSMELAV